MRRLLLAFGLVCLSLSAQTHRFPPIDTYNGDPSNVSCTVANSIVQSTTTGGLYTCTGGVYISQGGASYPGVTSNGASGLNVAGAVNATTVAAGVSILATQPLGSIGTKFVCRPTGVQYPECYGAIGDGAKHPLSSITQLGSTNTTGWTLAQWQTIYPFADSLNNEIDRLAFQLVAITYCNTSSAAYSIYVSNAYWFDETWDATNAYTGPNANNQCAVTIDGPGAQSLKHGALFWDGNDATGLNVSSSTTASGGTLCATNNCTMTLTVPSTGGGLAANILVTLPTGGSWSGASFVNTFAGDNFTTVPTSGTLSNGGSGTATLSNVSLGNYNSTPMIRLSNSQNSTIQNISLWGGDNQNTPHHRPNGIQWNERGTGFAATAAVNTHNNMRNVWVGGTSAVSPYISLYNCFEWTGSNTNNDQMSMDNLWAHACYDAFLDPLQQSVLKTAKMLTVTDSQDAAFVLNANWKIDTENSDRNPVVFRFTNNSEYGPALNGQGLMVFENINPESDGQFINAGTSQGLSINVEGGSWSGTNSNGVISITSASGGTPCTGTNCTVTLSGFNANCNGTVVTATLPSGPSWTGATFAVVNRGFECSYTGPTTAVLSNGGSGTVTLTGATVMPVWIDVHGNTTVSLTLDHFNLFSANSYDKVDLSSSSAAVKTFKMTNMAGTVPVWCRTAANYADTTGNLIVSPVDSSGSQITLKVNGSSGSDYCDMTFGGGNVAQVIGNNQNSQRGSLRNYTKSGALSYTLSGDYNSATDTFVDTQNGNSSFQTPAHRWDWNVTGVESGTDTGTGSDLCLKRQIGTNASPTVTNVMCMTRATGVVNFTVSPTVPTPASTDSSNNIANTSWVQSLLASPCMAAEYATLYEFGTSSRGKGICLTRTWLDNTEKANWPLNEGSGTAGNDQSGAGLNLTWTGTAAGNISGTYYSTPTVATYGFPVGNFNGTNDKLTLSSTSLKPAFPVTISAWVLLNNTSQAGLAQASVASANLCGFWLQISSGGKPTAGFGDCAGGSSTDYNQFVATSGISTGAFHHLFAVIQGSGNITLYVDGVSVAGSYSGTATTMAYDTTPMIVLGGDGSVFPYFNGLMRNVRVWGSAKNSTDATQRYNSGQ